MGERRGRPPVRPVPVPAPAHPPAHTPAHPNITHPLPQAVSGPGGVLEGLSPGRGYVDMSTDWTSRQSWHQEVNIWPTYFYVCLPFAESLGPAP
jgi:hypothetical protein